MAVANFDEAVRLYRVALTVFEAPQELRDRFENMLNEILGEAQLDEAIVKLLGEWKLLVILDSLIPENEPQDDDFDFEDEFGKIRGQEGGQE
jgi:hypothetical protein